MICKHYCLEKFTFIFFHWKRDDPFLKTHLNNVEIDVDKVTKICVKHCPDVLCVLIALRTEMRMFFEEFEPFCESVILILQLMKNDLKMIILY